MSNFAMFTAKKKVQTCQLRFRQAFAAECEKTRPEC